MSVDSYICNACGQEVAPDRVHLSDIDHKYFRLVGQRLVMVGAVDGRNVESAIGVFIPEVMDSLAPAIVGALKRNGQMSVMIFFYRTTVPERISCVLWSNQQCRLMILRKLP